MNDEQYLEKLKLVLDSQQKTYLARLSGPYPASANDFKRAMNKTKREIRREEKLLERGKKKS